MSLGDLLKVTWLVHEGGGSWIATPLSLGCPCVLEPPEERSCRGPAGLCVPNLYTL